MSFIKEFKEFAVKGNLIDFAIGVVVGGAFGKVTTAFVDGMVMPVVGKLTIMSNRTSYVISRNGRIAFVHSDFDWSKHVSQTLAAVKALKKR